MADIRDIIQYFKLNINVGNFINNCKVVQSNYERKVVMYNFEYIYTIYIQVSCVNPQNAINTLNSITQNKRTVISLDGTYVCDSKTWIHISSNNGIYTIKGEIKCTKVPATDPIMFPFLSPFY